MSLRVEERQSKVMPCALISRLESNQTKRKKKGGKYKEYLELELGGDGRPLGVEPRVHVRRHVPPHRVVVDVDVAHAPQHVRHI